ncbi:unnamed protein product [Amoebophrya sp. A25]|nr:unnamed protein product [Amoebophrya sp. A25]|eukprot:GSA25T00006787001.1
MAEVQTESHQEDATWSGVADGTTEIEQVETMDQVVAEQGEQVVAEEQPQTDLPQRSPVGAVPKSAPTIGSPALPKSVPAIGIIPEKPALRSPSAHANDHLLNGPLGSSNVPSIVAPYAPAPVYLVDPSIIAAKGAVTDDICGVLKVYDPNTGWGFVLGNEQTSGTDIFIHRGAFEGNAPLVHVTALDPEDIRPKIRYRLDWTSEEKPKVDKAIMIADQMATGGIEMAKGQSRVCVPCLSTIAGFHGICSVCKGKGDGTKGLSAKGFGKGGYKGAQKGRSGPYTGAGSMRYNQKG